MSGKHTPSKFTHSAPYPTIKVQEPNLHYAELLMDDYAGVVSEVTAINQYFFHHVMFEEIDEDLAELLEGVAIVEMYHMEMLAETIRKLGGFPSIRGSYSSCGNYWNGSFVYYGYDICDRIVANINAEKSAIENYNARIRQIADPYIKALLERIILDEVVHLELFNKALEKYNCKLR